MVKGEAVPHREPANVREATVLFELVRALTRAGEFNAQDQAPPNAILWTDKDRQWEPLMPRLREILPALLALGPYTPGERTGPAIWLKCMLAMARFRSRTGPRGRYRSCICRV